MRTIVWLCLCWCLANDVMGQPPEPPLSDTRLSIHTLVREDIFAGWRAQDMQRFARGENNIERLLETRPDARADLLAWKGAAKLFRAVLAHESDNREEFERYLGQSRELFKEARELNAQSGGVAAVIGGSYVTFADRLPEDLRAAAWSEAYQNYQVLWKAQSAVVDKLPLHIRGELLAGLAQSAQRTGRGQEFNQYLDTILEVLPGTGYGRVAKRWKEEPQLAAKGNISCKTCHAPGRLKARIAQNKQ